METTHSKLFAIRPNALRTLWLTLLAFVAWGSPSHGADAGTYYNSRFGYRIEIPAGFGRVREAANGDGGVSTGKGAELRFWGGYLSEENFQEEVVSRTDLDISDGWSISYEKRLPAWASWSGVRNGRIMYSRAIVACNGAAAYFRIEYDIAQKREFDPIIDRLVRSLKANSC